MPAEARRHPGLALALTLVLAAIPCSTAEVPLETLLAERRYEEALAALLVRTEEWALEVKNNDSPAARLDWARSLLSLGMVEDRLGRYEPAIGHLRQALELIESAKGPKGLIGDCHDALGLALSHDGNFADAETHLLQAIGIRAAAPDGEREPWLSASRDHLALAYLQDGRYREAGPLFQESLRATPEDALELLAQRYGYVGRFYQTVHSNARARDHLEKAVEMAERAWGEDHPNTLSLLAQLGLVLNQLGETAKARANLEEVVRLTRKTAEDTTGRLRLAGFLNNLGSLELSAGNLEAAQTSFSEALQVLEASLGPGHLSLAPLRNNLACTLQDLGAFKEANTLLVQTRDAYLKHMGPTHQRSAEALSNLALNTLLQSGPSAARDQIAETAKAAEKVLQRLIRFGTERQRLNYLRDVDLLSLACSAGEDPSLIADLLLSSKGRLLDVLLSERTDEDSPGLRRYREVQQELDLLLLSAANPDPQEVAALRRTLQDLESKLGGNNGPDGSDAPTWQDVQAGLPADGAFVDFVRFTDHLDDRRVRYGAVLILPTGPPAWVPLDGEKELQTWLQAVERRLAYRTALLGGQENATTPVVALKPALRQLHDRFWAPVAATLPDTVRSVCLCPDGALNFVSFAVLLDEEDRFLASRYDLGAFVSSGRDLLLPARSSQLADAPWQVFSVESFAKAPEPRGDTPFQESLVRAIYEMKPLAGAAREVELLKPFFGPGSTVHTDAQATEATLRRIPEKPAVLHLITHGFFLGDGPGADERLQDYEDNPLPFYLSGLVLQGAKQALSTSPPPAPGADDILFASDVAGLPLDGTELVTLSSCQSALGDSLGGEGVLGLRRGFASAGARNLLLTLWPVSDVTTPDYMRRFYELARETGHLSQSAWQAQREGLADVDPDDAEQLESAVLTMGPFILCQRQGLSPPRAFSPPSAPSSKGPLYLGIAIGLAIAGAFFLLTRRKG